MQINKLPYVISGTNLLPNDMKFFNYCDPDLLRAMNSPTKSSQLQAQGRGYRTTKSPALSRAPSPTPTPSESGTELGMKPLVSEKEFVWCLDLLIYGVLALDHLLVP